MKEYIITVNGQTYEVQVEESSAPSTAVPAQRPTPAPIPTPKTAIPTSAAPKPSTQTAAPAGSKPIKSPMPGTIVKINVKVGDAVKSGTILCILEAMKMENEIVAPSEGKVVSINTSTGASVNSGDVLISIA